MLGSEIATPRGVDSKGSSDSVETDGGAVLIVDDSSSDRFLYERLLSAAGRQYRVVKAGDIEQGLRCLESEKPACVLLDYWLSDNTGWDFLDAMTAKGVTLPVVLLTSASPDEISDRGARTQVVDVLYKDKVTVDSLHAAIENAISTDPSELVLPGPETDYTSVSGKPISQDKSVPKVAESKPASESAETLSKRPQFEYFFDQQPDLCFVVQRSTQTIVRCGAAGLRAWGLTRQATVGSRMEQLTLLHDPASVALLMGDKASDNAPIALSVQTASGRIVAAEAFIFDLPPSPGAKGSEYRFIQIRDQSALANMRKRFESLQNQKQDSSAIARHQFEVAIVKAWAESIDIAQPVGVAIIEVAIATALRDQYGSEERERWMARCEKLLKSALRKGSTLVRIDYDRFGVVIKDGKDLTAAELADDCVTATRTLERPEVTDAPAFHVGCAFVVPTIQEAPASVLRIAEESVIAARDSGILVQGNLPPMTTEE